MPAPQRRCSIRVFFFFFNDTATTEIYTLSLHDALPICTASTRACSPRYPTRTWAPSRSEEHTSELQSRVDISYAVFCLKKKKQSVATLYSHKTPQSPNLSSLANRL